MTSGQVRIRHVFRLGPVEAARLDGGDVNFAPIVAASLFDGGGCGDVRVNVSRRSDSRVLQTKTSLMRHPAVRPGLLL